MQNEEFSSLKDRGSLPNSLSEDPRSIQASYQKYTLVG